MKLLVKKLFLFAFFRDTTVMSFHWLSWELFQFWEASQLCFYPKPFGSIYPTLWRKVKNLDRNSKFAVVLNESKFGIKFFAKIFIYKMAIGI